MLTFSQFSDLCLAYGFKTPVISENDYNNLDYHSEPYLTACVEKASLGYSFEYFSSILLRRYKRAKQ